MPTAQPTPGVSPGGDGLALARLGRARRAADLLDRAVALPGGIRIGLDPILGLIPVVGDWISQLLGLYVCYQAYRADVPATTLGRMVGNLVVDAVVGSVPVVGDVVDVTFRANVRNVALFERALADRVAAD